MRPEARLKLGYYPLPSLEAQRIAKWLHFSEAASVLDPCAGTGSALATIAPGRDMLRFAIELDAHRAAEAKTNADEVIQGSAFDCHAPVESFSLLYLNPPYDFEIGEGKNARMETIFLEQFYRWLKPGGVLVLVIPFDRVYACRRVLSSHFRDKVIYRLSCPESLLYKQIVLFGIRRTRQERDRLTDLAVQQSDMKLGELTRHYEAIPVLTEEPSRVYAIPPSPQARLEYRGLPLDTIEDMLQNSPASLQAQRVTHARATELSGRPLTPLHKGHVGPIRHVANFPCKSHQVRLLSTWRHFIVEMFPTIRCMERARSGVSVVAGERPAASFRLFRRAGALGSGPVRQTPTSSPKGAWPLLRLISTPDLAHKFQIVRDDGLPDVQLTVFADDLLKSLSPSSVPIYMRELLAILYWAQSDPVVVRSSWTLSGPPLEVRNIVREYLTVAAKCKVTSRADRLGLKIAYVCQTSETSINIRILLAVLRRYYDHLNSVKVYGHANPLLQEDMAKVSDQLRANYRRTIRETEGRDPMPPTSGVDPPFGIRLSANYFRCVNEEWIPKTIDDPDFPNLVYQAGKDYGWGLRELCVVRMLFESGARISEILDLTLADWSVSQFMNQFVARNKGSFGIRTKRLVVSSVTAKLCRRYFDNEKEGRRTHDKQRLMLSDLPKLPAETLAKTRLFLTTRGTPMEAKVFRRGHWTPALRAAGIQANPPCSPLVCDQRAPFDRADVEG